MIAGTIGMRWLSTSAPIADWAFCSPTTLVQTNAANVVQISPMTPHLMPARTSSRRMDQRRSIRGPLPRILVMSRVTQAATTVGTIVPMTMAVGEAVTCGAMARNTAPIITAVSTKTAKTSRNAPKPQRWVRTVTGSTTALGASVISRSAVTYLSVVGEGPQNSTRRGDNSRSFDDPTAEEDPGRLPERVQVHAGVLVVGDDVGRGALLDPPVAQPGAGRPGGGADGVLGGHTHLVERDDLVDDAAVCDAAAGVRAGVPRDARRQDVGDGLPDAAVQVEHVSRVDRVLRRGLREARERLDVDQRRDQRGAVGGHQLDRVGREPGAVLDAVDAGGDEARQRLLAEHVRGDPGAGLVGDLDRLGQHVVRPQRREVALVAVDPVADQLDPAVACGGLFRDHGGQQLRRPHLLADVADVPLGSRDVPAGADDPWQLQLLLQRPGVQRGATVTDEQGAGVAVGERVLLGLVEVRRRESDVAVRVDQSR